MKYPWIFEFLCTEIFVFGQMFGDFTEFSVEFSRRESWQYFAALCQSQPIYELSPIEQGVQPSISSKHYPKTFFVHRQKMEHGHPKKTRKMGKN